METVLITGGTGMIGKALTQALIERGFKVINSSQHLTNNEKRIDYAFKTLVENGY